MQCGGYGIAFHQHDYCKVLYSVQIQGEIVEYVAQRADPFASSQFDQKLRTNNAVRISGVTTSVIEMDREMQIEIKIMPYKDKLTSG